MTDIYKSLFRILGAAALGIDSGINEKIDSQIFEIAKKNSVIGIAISEFKKYVDLGLLDIPAEKLDAEISALTARVFSYSQKQYTVNDVITRLENKGIPCIILKGDTLGVMYHNPDLRMSNDTDILIDKKHEKKCLEFFRKENAYVKKRNATNNQSVIVHPKGGVFEVHISLDTKQVSEVWYDSMEFIKEPLIDVTVSKKYTYKTLGYTDNAINLMLHFIKHFVGGIAHARMMTDTVLYFERYWDKIDFSRFYDTMRHLKYENIAESLFYIGNKYFGFSSIKIKEEYENLADGIISDMAMCCDYGYALMEEKSGIYEAYSKNRYSTFMKKDYKSYKRKIILTDAFDLIFKNKYEMMKLYPALEKNIYLLPFMYCHRAFKCIKNTLLPKKTVAKKDEKLEKIKEKRLELIDELDMT